jgi:hypothetical protein
MCSVQGSLMCWLSVAVVGQVSQAAAQADTLLLQINIFLREVTQLRSARVVLVELTLLLALVLVLVR